MELESSLRWPDYLILAGFLAISLGIGLYTSFTGGRQKTTAEFIMANRNLKVIPTAISLLVSYQSAILILGMAAEMYWYGVQMLIMTIAVFTVVTLTTVLLFIPWIMPLKMISVYEYLQMRYCSRTVRIFGATLGIISSLLYMGVAMYAPSAALESATGLPLEISIILMAAVCVTYTALGGMRAVIWTDVFQFVTMIGGILAILIRGVIVVGGFSKVFELCEQEGRMVWADWNPDPRVRHTVYGFMFGYATSWMQWYGLSQASVQRYSATKNLTTARLTVLLNLPGLILLEIVTCFTGLVVLAYYSSTRCDPLSDGKIANFNQLLPHFVMELFTDSPGFAGLFLATLYGGALSSVSSSLSGSAANCWEDMLNWKLSHMQESRKALVNRILVIVFGFISTGVAFLAATAPGPITQISLAFQSSVLGPLMGLFLLGGVSKLGNWKGAMIGGLLGLGLTSWISFGSLTLTTRYPNFPPVAMDGCASVNLSVTDSYGAQSTIQSTSHDFVTSGKLNHKIYLPNDDAYLNGLKGLENFYAISYIWYSFIGALATVVLGNLASLFFRDKRMEDEIGSHLLLSPIRYMQELNCSLRSKSESDVDIQLKHNLNNNSAQLFEE